VKSSKAIVLGAVLVVAATTGTLIPIAWNGRRSAQPLSPAAPEGQTAFDPQQSAALFVGVRRFTHDEISEVRYAVDDAVDLAYVFALERRTHLVTAERVVLAISGRPEKPESHQRLRELEQAGADRAGTTERHPRAPAQAGRARATRRHPHRLARHARLRP
jgi:hypothetical protein